MPVSVVTDTTGYLPRELLDRYGITAVPLYVVFADRTVQGDRDHRLPGVLRGAAPRRQPAEDLPAVGRRLHRGLRAAARARRRDRLDPHLGRHLGHRRVGPPGGRAARARRPRRRARPRRRLGHRRRRPGHRHARGGALRAARRHARRGRRRRQPRPRRAEDVVRDRHARVPQARRADRRRERLDRLDAEDQADPDRRARAEPGRARAHQLADVRAAGRLRAAAPRLRRRRLGRPAHRRARRGGAAAPSAATRSSAATRCSSARSGPC